MAKAAVNKEYLTFVKGLITEAGPFTHPEGASSEEENFVLNRDGSRQRRLGMDYEQDAQLRTVTYVSDDAVTTFAWANVSGDTSLHFTVVQVGKRLYFYDSTKATVSSAYKGTYTVPVTNGKAAFQFAAGMGKLFIGFSDRSPLYVKYDKSAGTFSGHTINILIRDLLGIDDGLAIDERPLTLSASHHYNLLNQGWPETTKLTKDNTQKVPHEYFFDNSAKSVVQTLTRVELYGREGDQERIVTYETVVKDPTTKSYPSNADIPHFMKNGEGKLDAALLDAAYLDNTPAPRGKFIIDAFDRSTSRNGSSGLSTPLDKELGRPQAIAFGFNRVFYAGVRSNTQGEFAPDMTGYVFFSSTIRREDDMRKCYQEAAPTSEDISDIIETDGGYVNIQEAGVIHKLIAVGSSILVFADRGIWEIHGGEEGFKATSFQVTKVTNNGAMSYASVVPAEDTVLYWGKSGIYVSGRDKVSGRMQMENITESTIQTLYNSIPDVAKNTAIGHFDIASKKVSWLYNDTATYNGLNDRNKYNKELILDTVLGAFSVNSISSLTTNSPYVAGYVSIPGFTTADETFTLVTDAGLDIITATGDAVGQVGTVRTRGFSQTKYLAINPTGSAYQITFAQYRDTTFKDWKTKNSVGADYESFLVTGYEIMGDSMRKKQSPYVMFHLKRTETAFVDDGNGNPTLNNPSSCVVRSRWDFADSANSGKWGPEQQVYRFLRPYFAGIGETFDYGQDVITTKNKVRGRGRALSLHIRSESGKDMYLYGWAIGFTGNTAI